MFKFALPFLFLFLAGCAHQAVPDAAPSYGVYSAFSSKLKGKYLLAIETSDLSRVVKPSSYVCAAHKFPVSATESFKGSTRQTLAALVDEIEYVDDPSSASQIRAKGAKGLIIVRTESYTPKLRFISGFWSATASATAEIAATVEVVNGKGRLFARSFDAEKTEEAKAGGICEGGADALSKATSGALKKLMKRIGEAIANSERIRTGRAVRA